MQPASESYGFTRVVALNEAAKGLLALSYKVNLLAIDAMLQSKRGGAGLRGFDEVSSQMRDWTRDLHSRLQLLNTQCTDVVARTSLYSKDARALRLLEAAATQSDNAAMRQTAQRNDGAHTTLRELLDADWRQVRARLADLDQLGTMAVVLSRSAMIEAATGDAEQRAHLGQVSQEFYRHPQLAVQTIKQIIKQIRED